MWQYYVITELRIIYKDKTNTFKDNKFVICKEILNFSNYTGDVDSDETEYEQTIELYYKQQLKKYNKIINIYSDNRYIKPEFEKKYKRRINELIGNGCEIIHVFKTKYTQLKC